MRAGGAGSSFLAMRASSVARLIAGPLAALVLGAAACSGSGDDNWRGWDPSPAAKRGETTFAMGCASCHNFRNPFERGIQGPDVARSSRELLEARIMRAEYPPDYTPKQAGNTMAKLPQYKDRIDDLFAFLSEVPDPDAVPEAK